MSGTRNVKPCEVKTAKKENRGSQDVRQSKYGATCGRKVYPQLWRQQEWGWNITSDSIGKIEIQPQIENGDDQIPPWDRNNQASILPAERKLAKIDKNMKRKIKKKSRSHILGYVCSKNPTIFLSLTIAATKFQSQSVWPHKEIAPCSAYLALAQDPTWQEKTFCKRISLKQSG